MENRILEAALNYLQKYNFSVIPVGPDKKPLVKWTCFQKQKADEKQIRQWWAKWPTANVGIVTGAISKLCVVDIDEDQGREEIQPYIPDSLLMPTVQTPRGGQHLYFQSPNPPLGNNSRIIPGCDFRGEGGYVVASPSVNGTGAGYSFMPGLSLEDVEPPPLPAPYKLLINKYALGGGGGKGRNSDDKDHVTNVTNYFQDHQRDEHLFHAANCLVKGGAEYEFALNILDRLAKSCPPGDHPLEKNIAEIKLKSALQRVERRERNIHKEVEKWLEFVTSGYFLVTDCYNELHLLHPEEKTACRVALHRMKEEGLIEEVGDRRGKYRKRKTEIIRIDLDAPRMPRLDLKWPLGIEDYVYINSKSIIVNAGETDAGKTGFDIDFAGRNKHLHKIHYFTTEMGQEDMQDRLSKYGKPLEWWKNLDIIERESEFEDAIFPNDINIIDYLSVPIDKVWAIKEPIDRIFFKLKKGIALISLQMGQGQNLPYGKSWG